MEITLDLVSTFEALGDVNFSLIIILMLFLHIIQMSWLKRNIM